MNFLITAGPTREPIDPVRFISNRSTGKMGYALAEAAHEAGHEVTLISGPVALTPPQGVQVIDVTTACEMLHAVEAALPAADIYISTAAVADWRPATPSPTKLKKSAMSGTLQLVPNPDILKTIAPLKGDRIFVGFAAETGDPQAEAQRKLIDKQLDYIVANDVTQPDAGFVVDTNRVVLYSRASQPLVFPLLTKTELARQLIAHLLAR